MIAMLLVSAVLLLAVSRGAWLGTVAGIFALFGLRAQYGRMLRLLLILAPAIALLWAFMPTQQKEYALGFGAERENIKLRLDTIDFTWKTFLSSPIIGKGVALRKEIDATNLATVTLAETGVLGFAAFVALQIAVCRTVWRTWQKLPPGSAYSSPVALGGALTLARLVHGMVDHYWSRGAITQAWAAVGMTILISRHVAVRRVPQRAQSPSARNAAMGGSIP